jgi:hypothetical protein
MYSLEKLTGACLCLCVCLCVCVCLCLCVCLEQCHHCRHPCFFTLIRSEHPDAVVPSEPADPSEASEDYAIQMKGGGGGAAAPADDADAADAAAAGAAAGAADEAPIPLVSCLSPCCVSKLPGTLEQLEIL